jgi:hypothetical protein
MKLYLRCHGDWLENRNRLDWERIFILGEIFPGTAVIKVKVKVNFTLAQAMKAENG